MLKTISCEMAVLNDSDPLSPVPLRILWGIRRSVPAASGGSGAARPGDECAAGGAVAGAGPCGDARAGRLVETVALLRALKDHGAHTKAGAKL